MSEEWKAMSSDAKAKYEQMCTEDKERYNREMIAYNAQKQEKEEKNPKKAEKPAGSSKKKESKEGGKEKKEGAAKKDGKAKKGKKTKTPKATVARAGYGWVNWLFLSLLLVASIANLLEAIGLGEIAAMPWMPWGQ